MSATPTWISQRRAAEKTGLPYTTVRALVRAGQLPGVRHGRGYLIGLDALDHFLKTRGVQRPEIVA